MLRPPYTKYSRLYTYHLEGCTLSTFADPDLIGRWEEDGRTILIFHRAKDDLVAELCRRKDCSLFYQADLDYRDWEMGREVTPFTVGSLTVAPVWDQAEADIRIDPSVVFGNGFHPSTRLCLEALVDYRNRLPNNFAALDLGCGTGLLAVCAARLGAASVLAIDHNPLACRVAEKNATLNKVDSPVRVSRVDLKTELPATKVDLVMANLHYGLLARLFQNPAFWQAGLYIMSGFMPGEEERLLGALPDPPPLLLARRRQDKWCAWILGPAYLISR